MKERHLTVILATCALLACANAAPVGEIKGVSQSEAGPVVVLPAVATVAGGLPEVSPPGNGAAGSGLLGGGTPGGVKPPVSGGEAGLTLPGLPSSLPSKPLSGSSNIGGAVIVGGTAGGSQGLPTGKQEQELQTSGPTMAVFNPGQPRVLQPQASQGPGFIASAGSAAGGPSLGPALSSSAFGPSASAAGAARGPSLNLGLSSTGLGTSSMSAPHGGPSGLAGPTASLGAGRTPSGGNIGGMRNTPHHGILPAPHVSTPHGPAETIPAVVVPAGPTRQPVPLLPSAAGAVSSGSGSSLIAAPSRGHFPAPVGQTPAVPPVVALPGGKPNRALQDVKTG